MLKKLTRVISCFVVVLLVSSMFSSLAFAFDYGAVKSRMDIIEITGSSVTINVEFPASGTWGNNLAIYDYATEKWLNFNNKSCTVAPYRTNGIYTQTDLKPNAKYKVWMSWYNSSTGKYENNYGEEFTTGPSLKILGASQNEISLQANFLESEVWANKLSILNTATGVWSDINNKPCDVAPYRKSGIYTQGGLSPNTKYGIFMSWYNSKLAKYENLPVQYVTTGSLKRVLVLVNKALYTSMQNSSDKYDKEMLHTYKLDLLKEGYDAVIEPYDNSIDNTAQSLKNVIKSKYSSFARTNSKLAGVFLIGNLPYATVEGFDVAATSPYDKFGYSDWYFSDVDGIWTDTNQDMFIDTIKGNSAPDFWIGRLYFGSNRETVSNYGKYFYRNHLYRNNLLGSSKKALFFSWAKADNPNHAKDGTDEACKSASDNLKLIYPNTTVVAPLSYADERTMVLNEAKKDYELFDFTAHSNPFVLGQLNNTDIATIKPSFLFANTHACSTARFTENDYVTGTLFTEGNMLAYVGATMNSVYFPAQDAAFKATLKTGCWGDAVKQIYSKAKGIVDNQGGKSAKSGYENTLIGDPTLKIK